MDAGEPDRAHEPGLDDRGAARGRPRAFSPSFVVVVFLAFVGALLPLFAAVVLAVDLLERLDARSRRAVEEASRLAAIGSEVSDTLPDLERYARQYAVLADPEILDAFHRSLSDLRAAWTGGAEALPLDLRAAVADLDRQLDDVESTLSEAPWGSEPEARARASADLGLRFAPIARAARMAESAAGQTTRRRLATLQQEASDAQQLLAGLAVALIPACLGVSVLLARAVGSPVRQLDRAIRRIGRVELDDPVRIPGPRDLRALGERLDWLRLRLLHLETERARSLRHLSHELKTPLTAIHESVKMLIGGRPAEESARRELAAILDRNVLRLRRSVEELLVLAVTGPTAEPLRGRRLDLAELVREVLAEQAPSLRRVTVRTELAPVVVAADRGRLAIVLENLLSNAVKYGGGRIDLRLGRRGDEAVLRVRDDGPGVLPGPPGSGPVLSSTTFSSSGLGLDICREHLLAHGGSLTLIEADGGACFEVRLPLSPTRSAGE